jgi:uncharacterized protein YggE
MTQNTPTISVRGVGRVSVPPDRTVVTFHISSLNKVYSESAAEINTRVAELRKRLADAGIPGTDLKTTSFTIEPEHEWRGNDKDRRQVFMGWRSKHTMRLELPVDRELLNKAFAAIATDEVQSSIEIGFEVSDLAALRTKILEEATRVACRNAEAIARAAGCTLGPATSINYNWSEIRFRGMHYAVAERADLTAMSAPDIEPDDVEGEDSVSVVFELKG